MVSGRAGPTSPTIRSHETTRHCGHGRRLHRFLDSQRGRSEEGRPGSAAPALQRCRGHHPADAARHGREARHLSRDRASVPHPHRDVRGSAERGHHGQQGRPQGGGRAGSRKSGREGPRSAPRNPGGAQGQHSHHPPPHHRRRLGLRRVHSELRGDAHPEPARRGSHHHRQDRHERTGELGGVRHARKLQRPHRLRHESLRPAPRSARGQLRRPAGSEHGRFEFRASALPRTSGPRTWAPKPRDRS